MCRRARANIIQLGHRTQWRGTFCLEEVWLGFNSERTQRNNLFILTDLLKEMMTTKESFLFTDYLLFIKSLHYLKESCGIFRPSLSFYIFYSTMSKCIFWSLSLGPLAKLDHTMQPHSEMVFHFTYHVSRHLQSFFACRFIPGTWICFMLLDWIASSRYTILHPGVVLRKAEKHRCAPLSWNSMAEKPVTHFSCSDATTKR